MEKAIRGRLPPKLLRENEPRQDPAVIFRNTPSTYNWGWFSREDQRMHEQVVDRKHVELHYKVWLENKGRRVFEPEPGIPAKVLKKLGTMVRERREYIEAEWAAFMIRSDWLRVCLVGDSIVLYAYPESHNHFERSVALHDMIPNKEIAAKVTAKDVALNEEFAFLEMFPSRPESRRDHEPLPRVLWFD